MGQCAFPSGSLERPLLAHFSLPFPGLAQGPLPCLFWVRSQPSCADRSPVFFGFILALSTICLWHIFLEECTVSPERQARTDQCTKLSYAAQGWLRSVLQAKEGPLWQALQPNSEGSQEAPGRHRESSASPPKKDALEAAAGLKHW